MLLGRHIEHQMDGQVVSALPNRFPLHSDVDAAMVAKWDMVGAHSD